MSWFIRTTVSAPTKARRDIIRATSFVKLPARIYYTSPMNRKTARSLIRLGVAALGLFPLAAFLVGRRVIVRGESMLPALRPGDRVLFDRLAYLIERQRRWDVVLARHPARPGVLMVKRV